MRQIQISAPRLFLSLVLFFLSFTACAQDQFKPGDLVEASYAGDWYRAKITSDYTPGDFGPTYEVNFKDWGPMRLAAKWVRPLFRTDVGKRFQPGDAVEFRRWNDKVYEGIITGVDGDRYEISYEENGSPSKEWVREIAVREGKKTAGKKEELKLAPKIADGPKAKGQKYRIGERVMYDELGFLVTKSFGTVVAYDAEKRLYTIRDEKDPSLKYSYPCYNVLTENEALAYDFFLGKWDVRIGGAMTSSEKDNKKTTTFSGGMRLYPLEIKANGTYSWKVSAKKTITGKWQPRQGLPGITLLKGIDGKDWTVYETTEAFGTSKTTKDEIRFHDLSSGASYYVATRPGPGRSCVLAGRVFQ